ncbi:hypothetical protein, partial [uncultured Prevotella sp.]|uniref:hypothetical protein n=1 Tax=uncultured Prevotella sp. TaxID=159272 RepID=UPI002606A254
TLLNLVLLEVSFVLESGCKGITKSLYMQEFRQKSLQKYAFLVLKLTYIKLKALFVAFLL